MSDFSVSSNQTLENYFREISEYNLLSAEDEVDLAQRIKEGDQKALNRLVNANLRFVVSVAKSYQNHGLSLEDLINEGNLGLMKAAYRFDETRGFKFISYAVWWIRQSILQAIAEKTRLVRLPLNRVGTLTKIGKVYSALEQEFERAPTPSEIAEVLDLESEEVGDDTIVRINPKTGEVENIEVLFFSTRLLRDELFEIPVIVGQSADKGTPGASINL